ncbi:MAG TPA: arginase family protein [Gemmatimonadales bacterium]|jgi:arginase|nr:arginase family protein [Gemmatimonadales bacterium]
MDRPISIVGAPINIGIKPYDDGQPRGLDRAPGVLRRLGLAARLDAADEGDVGSLPYRDLVKPEGRPRNEQEMVGYSRKLANRVAAVVDTGRFPLVLGGDCSIVLGSLLALRRGRRRVGLAYVDGHADFATPLESRTGSVASMCLGLAVGRGDTPLSRLAEGQPLVRAEDVALVGRRDEHEPWSGHVALHASAVLDLPHRAVREAGYGAAAVAVLARLGGADLEGFWIHLDADVLDPGIMPAVDSPEPDGPDLGQLAELLGPLVRHPGALGMELTIYDPLLDPEYACGARLVSLLEMILVRKGSPVAPYAHLMINQDPKLLEK